MPNGMLCAKAVIEMILGYESGAPVEYVVDRLVRTGGLPSTYSITEERIERCKKLDSIYMQAEKGTLEADATV